jgi:uncharacterized protein (DUF2252 family)
MVRIAGLKNELRTHSPTPALTMRVTRARQGKALRRQAPRSSQAELRLAKGRHPLEILAQTDVGRAAALLPIRYGRMVQSPFAFLRGSAAVMAFDLAQSPVSTIQVQACGDCHVMNFGAFATPERQLVFDLNDFDETLPAPWEWDIKRLAASIWVAGRYCHFGEHQCAEAVLAAVRTYREKLAEYAAWPKLQIWYAKIDAKPMVTIGDGAKIVESTAEAAAYTAARLLPKLTDVTDGRRRIKDQPPLVYHPRRETAFKKSMGQALRLYHDSLPPERRVLLDSYQFVDVAMKVVGVGSVGTVCAIALLMADEDDSLFLQIRQARPSVLEPYAGRSAYRNEGQRIVEGQRLMQSASDLFLGWSRIGKPPLDFYVRQLRDMKISVTLDNMRIRGFINYAGYCGWAVARSQAKTGDAAMISGYLGKNDAFDQALKRFARAYADQTERDHAILIKAVRAGRVHAETDSHAKD